MLLRITMSLCLVPLLIGYLWAQGVSNGPQGAKLHGFGEVDGTATVDFWAEHERRNTLDEFNLHIDLIREVCELSEAETEKLRLAAKGVTARRISAGREQLFKFIVDSELVEKAPTGMSFKEEYPNKLRAFGAAKLEPGMVYLQTEFAVAATDDPLWTSVLESTLSDLQLQRLNEFYLVRNKSFLRAAVTMTVADLDQSVFLNDGQKSNVVEYFLKHFDSKITPQFPTTITQAQKLVRPAFQDLSHFESLLRPGQLDRLKTIAGRPKPTIGWGSPSR